MAGPSTHAVPMLFLALLVLSELSLAGSLGPGTPARNLPENHMDLQGPALWIPCCLLVRRWKCELCCGLTQGGEQIKLLCFPLRVSGRALVRGPSSLMKKAEPSEDQAPDATMEESSTSLAPTILYLTTMEAAPATEESLILPVTSLWPQAQPRPDGEVMPTLDMALFDWTDYEDLKPEVWPSAKKKEKHWGKLSSDGNGTSPAEGEPCDHHQDCLPGTDCCDLREHLCTPHNRGLNNKCFDDCMCMEGEPALLGGGGRVGDPFHRAGD
uniref:Dorsal inhibitory axon guidance protein n=1 Tax=Panthera tigris altaica TaxID=74533 RepID=A0A8C9K515_PANTA